MNSRVKDIQSIITKLVKYSDSPEELSLDESLELESLLIQLETLASKYLADIVKARKTISLD